jgi:hypothetical protein
MPRWIARGGSVGAGIFPIAENDRWRIPAFATRNRRWQMVGRVGIFRR